MSALEVIDHLGNFYLNYLSALFMGHHYEAHDHMSVMAEEASWNPFSFVLVYAEKNVFLGIIFWGNQVLKVLQWAYLVGVLVFEYRKLTGEVYLDSYLRANPELDPNNPDSDVFQEDDFVEFE